MTTYLRVFGLTSCSFILRSFISDLIINVTAFFSLRGIISYTQLLAIFYINKESVRVPMNISNMNLDLA